MQRLRNCTRNISFYACFLERTVSGFPFLFLSSFGIFSLLVGLFLNLFALGSPLVGLRQHLVQLLGKELNLLKFPAIIK